MSLIISVPICGHITQNGHRKEACSHPRIESLYDEVFKFLSHLQLIDDLRLLSLQRHSRGLKYIKKLDYSLVLSGDAGVKTEQLIS